MLLIQETGESPDVVKTSRFLDLGVLSLNEETLGQASGQRLWLLPKQTYLNVEENEGSALEKKRNIICCLLIQILKEEKEIHIDNLVFRVWSARHLVFVIQSSCQTKTGLIYCFPLSGD